MKVLFFCPNSVARDARIMKQARALLAAGHQIRLVGVRETPEQERVVQSEPGMEIVRINARSDGYRRAARALLGKLALLVAAAILVLIVALVASATALYLVHQTLAGWMTGGAVVPADSAAIWGSLAATAGLVLAGLMLACFGARKLSGAFGGVRRLIQMSVNYAAPESRSPEWRFALDRAISGPRPLSGVARALIDHLRTVTVQAAMQEAIKAAMVKEAMAEPFDLVLAAEAACLPAAAVAARRAGVAYCYDAHEFYDDLNGASFATTNRYRKIHKTHLSSAALVSVVSREMAQLYESRYGLSETPLVLPNATPRAMIDRVSQQPESLHALVGVPASTKLILYHGGLSPGRGIETLVRSAEHLSDDRALVFLGDGKLSDWLEQERLRQAHAWADAQAVSSAGAELSRLEELRIEARRRALADLNATFQVGSRTVAEAAVNSVLELPRAQQTSELVCDLQADSKQADAALMARVLMCDVDTLLEAKFAALAPRPNPSDYPKLRTHPSKPQAELLSWISEAFVEVIPYPNTGLNHWVCAPNKFWEAIGAGVPVVATPLGELTRLVNEGGCGWLLPAENDARSLANFLNHISAEDRAEKAEHAAEFRRGRDFEAFAKDWLTRLKTHAAPMSAK